MKTFSWFTREFKEAKKGAEFWKAACKAAEERNKDLEQRLASLNEQRLASLKSLRAARLTAHLIILNKAQTLSVGERDEFYRWLGATLPPYLSDHEAREICKKWDEYGCG